MFKKVILIILLVTISACDSSINNELMHKLEFNRYVIVKTIDPIDDHEKFGAFVILPSEYNKSYSLFEWIYLSDSSRVMNFKDDSVQLGKGHVSEKSGVSFHSFSISVAPDSAGAWWIEEASGKYQNNYTTEFCITRFNKIGQLNNFDFSSCNSFYKSMGRIAFTDL